MPSRPVPPPRFEDGYSGPLERARASCDVCQQMSRNGNLTSKSAPALARLQNEIYACQKCPRLRRYCQKVALEKRRAYQHENYWGLPVAGFGDPHAQLLVMGLAPAAHGANRTGRIFTGDRSGDWLYRALHKAGFANQPTSTHRDDGLVLQNTYVTCATRCAPPANKPSPTELKRCAGYLARELEILTEVRAYLVLGKIALDALWPWITQNTEADLRKPRFAHGARFKLPDERLLIMSYHPSQQNTFTRRLTEAMFDSVFSTAREFLSKNP